MHEEEKIISHPSINSIHDLISFRLAMFVNLNDRGAQLWLTRDHNLTLIEFRLMGIIGSSPSISFRKIQAITSLDKGQLSRTLKKLKDKKIVSTQIDTNDLRSSHLCLTDVGRHKFIPLYAEAKKRNQLIVSNLSMKECEQLFTLIDKMRPHLHERIEAEERASIND